MTNAVSQFLGGKTYGFTPFLTSKNVDIFIEKLKKFKIFAFFKKLLYNIMGDMYKYPLHSTSARPNFSYSWSNLYKME